MKVPARILVFAALFALVGLPAHAQSLVEAAAAAKAVRAAGMGWPAPVTSTKIYRNEDLKSEPTAAAAVARITPVASPTDATKTEAYWRGRLQPLAAQLTADVLAVAPLSNRYEELRARFNGMKTVFQQQLVGPEMFRVQTDLKTALDRVDGATRAIDDLKEEGRRAGALPGWLR